MMSQFNLLKTPITSFIEIDTKSYEVEVIEDLDKNLSDDWINVTRSIQLLLARFYLIISRLEKFRENKSKIEYIKFNSKDLFLSYIVIDFCLGNILYNKELMNEDIVISGLNEFIDLYKV